jgi:hypothetical protein
MTHYVDLNSAKKSPCLLSSVAFGFVSGRFFYKFSSIATSEVVLKSVFSCRFNLGTLAVALGVEELQS